MSLLIIDRLIIKKVVESTLLMLCIMLSLIFISTLLDHFNGNWSETFTLFQQTSLRIIYITFPYLMITSSLFIFSFLREQSTLIILDSVPSFRKRFLRILIATWFILLLIMSLSYEKAIMNGFLKVHSTNNINTTYRTHQREWLKTDNTLIYWDASLSNLNEIKNIHLFVYDKLTITRQLFAKKGICDFETNTCLLSSVSIQSITNTTVIEKHLDHYTWTPKDSLIILSLAFKEHYHDLNILSLGKLVFFLKEKNLNYTEQLNAWFDRITYPLKHILLATLLFCILFFELSLNSFFKKLFTCFSASICLFYTEKFLNFLGQWIGNEYFITYQFSIFYLYFMLIMGLLYRHNNLRKDIL